MRRLWLGTGWFIILAIIHLSLTPHPIDATFANEDKLDHMLAYGTLMESWLQIRVEGSGRMRLALAIIGLGGAMEIAQAFTPHRQADIVDAPANTSGVLLGWLAAPPRVPNFYALLAYVFPGTRC